MRWEDERYVRIYTRDTPDWLAMEWQGRAVFYELSRKVDRAGLVPLGKSGVRGLAGLLHMPVEVVERGVEELLTDGCVIRVDDGLLIRNFIEAQETPQSDRARKRAQRERDRDSKKATADEHGHDVTTRDETGHSVTNRDRTSQNVTESHAESRGVTDGHVESQSVTPYRAVPCCTVPDLPPTPRGGNAPEGSPPFALESAPAKRPRQRRPEQPMPKDWTPTDEHTALAAKEGVDMQREAQKFRFWADGKVAASWNGRFATWLMKAGEERKSRGEPPYVPPPPPRAPVVVEPRSPPPRMSDEERHQRVLDAIKTGALARPLPADDSQEAFE